MELLVYFSESTMAWKWNNTELDTQNIFDELSESQSIGEEVRKMEEQQKRDLYYYIRKMNKGLFFLNTIIVMFLAIAAIYIYIQEKESKTEFTFLAPVCQLFLWTSDITPNTCFGITPILKEYQWKLDKEIMNQWEKLTGLVGDVYNIENLNFSRSTVFLLEKSQDRLRPLKILEEFDKLKNTFAPIDTSEISCYDLTMNSQNILQITCDAFSSDWDTSIANLSEGKLVYANAGGTSISRASSFMDFIDNYADSPFQIREKPKTLTSNTVQSWPYTQRTTFTMELKYNEISHLSF